MWSVLRSRVHPRAGLPSMFGGSLMISAAVGVSEGASNQAVPKCDRNRSVRGSGHCSGDYSGHCSGRVVWFIDLIRWRSVEPRFELANPGFERSDLVGKPTDNGDLDIEILASDEIEAVEAGMEGGADVFFCVALKLFDRCGQAFGDATG